MLFGACASVGEMRQSPRDTASVFCVCESVWHSRPGCHWHQRGRGGNFEIDPIFGILNRAMLIAVHDDQSSDPLFEWK